MHGLHAGAWQLGAKPAQPAVLLRNGVTSSCMHVQAVPTTAGLP